MNWTSCVLLTLCLIGAGSCSSGLAPQESTVAESSSPKKREQTLPEKCRHLLAEPDPSTWNPTTQLYTIPKSAEGTITWGECMGVGNFRQ